MKIQHQNHQKTHNFSYKTEIQLIPVSEIFDINHFQINEPIFIVKFNSHCIETSQVDEKPTQQKTKDFVFPGKRRTHWPAEFLTSQKNFTLRFRQTPPVSERKRQTTDRSDRVANSDDRRRTSNGIDLPL